MSAMSSSFVLSNSISLLIFCLVFLCKLLKVDIVKLTVVVHTCNPSTREAEAGR
jgi:hypothetical protein